MKKREPILKFDYIEHFFRSTTMYTGLQHSLYEFLRLVSKTPGPTPSQPSAYRVLDFWALLRLVYRPDMKYRWFLIVQNLSLELS